MTNDTLRITVDAGFHDRRCCPVWIAGSDLPRRLTLHRAGRARPVPCQWDENGADPIVWWLVESTPAGSKADHVLSCGDRQRLPSARVTATREAAGWTIRSPHGRLAEFLCPTEGRPRLTLFGGGERLALLTHHERRAGDADQAEESQPRHWVRRAEPLVAQGPVLASLACAYAVVDRNDAPLWTETMRLRFFEGDAKCTLIDLDVAWLASTGGITLAQRAQGFDAGLPALRCELGARGRLIASPGRVGPREIEERPAPFLVVEGAARSLAILQRADSFGHPPRWHCAPDESTVDAVARLGPDGSDRPYRMPLGESIVMRYRFAVFRDKDPLAFAAARYLDFDCPPEVIRSSRTGQASETATAAGLDDPEITAHDESG